MQEKENGQWAHTNFKAFISYSHADAHLVRKLHSQLESYRLPKGLGEITSQNAGPRDLGRIFRDREYLSVAQDLSSTVKSALERSEVLVVICSPQAKASQWVEREIEYFRRLHPDRPILAALVEGEPEEAFPEALLEGGVEPLAADLRKEGDGWKLGFLKLVAGIVGVPLDALIQRDSQRQTTRVMAVTGVVGLFALCMMAMAFVAIQALNETQTLRQGSDEFVEELITDARRDLKEVGRLDILERMNNRILGYYQKQGDPRELPTDSIEIRARTLLAVGEDHEERGNLEAAKESFFEAHRATKELLARDPNNPDRIFAHAQSEYYVGYAEWRGEDQHKARPYWENYNELSLNLLSMDRNNPSWVMEAGHAQVNLGTLALRADGNNRMAAEHFDAALKQFEMANELSPGNNTTLRQIANANAWIADAKRRDGDSEGALKHRASENRILTQLLQQAPKNKVIARDLVGNAIGTSQALLDAGKHDEAHALLIATEVTARDLARKSPEIEKIQLQEKFIGLLLAREDYAVFGKAPATLIQCIKDTVVQGNAELRAFCAHLRIRAGIGENDETEPFQSPFPNMTLTPRWGLEL